MKFMFCIYKVCFSLYPQSPGFTKIHMSSIPQYLQTCQQGTPAPKPTSLTTPSSLPRSTSKHTRHGSHIPNLKLGQARPGHDDGFMAALAWPGVLKSQLSRSFRMDFGRIFEKGWVQIQTIFETARSPCPDKSHFPTYRPGS